MNLIDLKASITKTGRISEKDLKNLSLTNLVEILLHYREDVLQSISKVISNPEPNTLLKIRNISNLSIIRINFIVYDWCTIHRSTGSTITEIFKLLKEDLG